MARTQRTVELTSISTRFPLETRRWLEQRMKETGRQSLNEVLNDVIEDARSWYRLPKPVVEVLDRDRKQRKSPDVRDYIDIDNNKVAILAPGQRTDVSVDWDFVVDGERITKVGPRSVTFLPDGSLRSDEGSLPDSIDPIRPANPEERRAVEVLIKEHPPEPCQLPDPPTTWPSPIVAF